MFRPPNIILNFSETGLPITGTMANESTKILALDAGGVKGHICIVRIAIT